MSILAIKGHSTRGKDIIEILEMLGGKNDRNYECSITNYAYRINEQGIIDWCIPHTDSHLVIFTLEEFLKKFPYRVGDKVQHKGATSCGSIFEIEKMRWEEDTIKYTLRLFGCNYKTCTLPAEYLQPYKEETVEDIIKIDIPKGYEFAGVDNQQVVFEKIEYQYPKTYDKCCEVLFPTTIELGKVSVHGYNGKLLEKFGELLICRNAYWKIAGEEMKLGKPWSPSKNVSVYCIFRFKGEIVKDNFVFGDSLILEFPTEEMRDAFFKNFKDLIEQCKELL